LDLFSPSRVGPGGSAFAVSPADLKHIQSASFIDLKWVDS
jgi:hypothetical protein